jgi:hypothetical protein
MWLNYRKSPWLVVGLVCFGVLLYFLANQDKQGPGSQSIVNEDIDAAGAARNGAAMSLQQDGPYLDPDADRPVITDSNSDQIPISVGEYLDPDGSLDKQGAAALPTQHNVGAFLDVDAKPGESATTGSVAQRNIGVFIDVDGNDLDSGFEASNEPKGINIGEFIDPDGSK